MIKSAKITSIEKIITLIGLLFSFSSPVISQGWQSSIVHYDGGGRLVYISDAAGNRIPDFSHAGYKGGGVALPNVLTVLTISPVAGDNTSNIQNAVNQVGALSLNSEGIRGALKLNPGVYRVSGTIRVNYDGVILRGSGQGVDSLSNTIILGTGNTPAARDIIVAGGGTNTKWSGAVSGTQTNITDDTVYVGSNVFHVENSSAYNVGDNIIVYHPCTDLWLQSVDYGGTNGTELWTVGSQPLVFNRYITAINGNEIVVDVPIFNTLVKSLSQSYIYKYNRSGIKTNIGIENLRVDITGWEPDTLDQSSSAWSAIALSQVENGWVKNCTATHFVYACVRTETATQITVDSCNGLNPIGSVDPADVNHRRYTFALDDASQQVLMQNCLATNGRHSFMSNGTSWVSGCVFYNVKVYNPYAPSEPHRRWSMGILYDNFKQLNGPLSGYSSELLGLYNRGDMGTGHGWSAAHCVTWNCDVADGDLLVQKPPTAQNYAIGCFGNVTGAKPPAPFVQPVGYIEGTGVVNLNPPSLYMAQLQERLGTKYSLKSGNWSDPSSWNNNTVPASNEDVVITVGDTIIIDISNALCNNLAIDGILQFPNNANGKGIIINGSVTIYATGSLKTLAQSSSGTALIDSIAIFGNLVNNGGTLDLRAGSGTSVSSNTVCVANVAFTGSANSIIKVGTYSSSNNEFNAITVNKSGGARVILQSDISTNTSSTVAGAVVTFANGIVETGNYTLISLATNSGTIVGGTATSYVNGNLGRARSSTPGSLVYPIGDSSGYRPLTVYTSTSGMTTKHYLTASVIHENANTGTGNLTGGIGSVSQVRYFKFTYNQSASTSPSMTFYKFAPSYDADDNITVGLQNLRVAVSNDNRITWVGHGPPNHTVNLDSPPTIITSDSLTTDQITLTDQQSAYICIAYELVPLPEAPLLVSPLNAETLASTSVLLKWRQGTSDVVAYWIELSTDSIFSNPIIDSTIADTTKQINHLFDTQKYWWRIRSKNGGGWGEFSEVRNFTCLISELSARMVNAGWNIISIPVEVADSRKSVLFPTAISDAFAFNAGYITVDSLKHSTGYWLKFDSAQIVSIRGAVILSDTLQVSKGWNLIGSIGVPFPVSSILTSPDSLILSSWFNYNGSYSAADTLQPFFGYWVKVKDDGAMILHDYSRILKNKIQLPHSKPILIKKPE